MNCEMKVKLNQIMEDYYYSLLNCKIIFCFVYPPSPEFKRSRIQATRKIASYFSLSLSLSLYPSVFLAFPTYHLYLFFLLLLLFFPLSVYSLISVSFCFFSFYLSLSPPSVVSFYSQDNLSFTFRVLSSIILIFSLLLHYLINSFTL